MSLTRRMLGAMGIEADKIDEIIAAHSETVEGLKADRDKYKADAEKLPKVQEELESYKAKAEESGPYKEKYDKEHAEFEAFKTAQTEKETKAKKSEAYKALLKEAGIADKYMGTVLKVSDLNSIELDKDGKVKDSDKTLESIKTEWSDFIVKTEQKGADTSNPPAGEGQNHTHHGTGRAAQLEAQYHTNLYGGSNDNNNGGKE